MRLHLRAELRIKVLFGESENAIWRKAHRQGLPSDSSQRTTHARIRKRHEPGPAHRGITVEIDLVGGFGVEQNLILMPSAPRLNRRELQVVPVDPRQYIMVLGRSRHVKMLKLKVDEIRDFVLQLPIP